MRKETKTPVKPHVKCEQCKFTSSTIQMKMHIKTVHSTKPRKVSKRLPNFTPMLKPSKKQNPELQLERNLRMNPGDESMYSFDEYIVPTGSNIVDCGKVIENLAYMEDTLGKSAEKLKQAKGWLSKFEYFF